MHREKKCSISEAVQEGALIMAEKSKNTSLYDTTEASPSVSPSVFGRMLETVRQQVDWELVRKIAGKRFGPIVDAAIKVMAEVYMLGDDYTIEIAGESVPAGMVKEIYRELTADHVIYAVNCFMRASSLIVSKKRYMRACLYNAYFELVLEEVNREAAEVTDDEQR
jgi:hypothetical protein